MTGIDIQRPLVALAAENAKKNGLEKRFAAVVGDLRQPPPRIAPAGFDHVMANPPYLEQGKATASPKEIRRIADMEGEAQLADWIRVALTYLKDGGSLTFIQRAERLPALLAGLEGKAGGEVVFPLWAGPDKPARRVLVQARKQSKAPLTLSRGLTLHVAEGGYSAGAERILRDAGALDLTCS